MNPKSITIFIVTILFFSNVHSQIIDVHLHSYTSKDYREGQSMFGLNSPKTADEHLVQTIGQMDKHGIEYAVISGTLESVEKYIEADSRFIPGYEVHEKLIPINDFENLIKTGRIKVFGEVGAQYAGRTLNDPIYDPYLKICEEYGVPIAYHTGGGPPMTPYNCCPKFRLSIGDPLLIEDVLVKYPKLQIYLMHAGGMFFENAIAMMGMYRHLYMDLGVMLWVDEAASIEILTKAKASGVLDRTLFGTDQMMWPEATTKSIEFLNSLDFLSEKEKRMILYENAKTFLKIQN